MSFMTADELVAFRAAGGSAIFADDYPHPWKRGQELMDDDWDDIILAAHVRQILEESMPALVEFAGRADAVTE